LARADRPEGTGRLLEQGFDRVGLVVLVLGGRLGLGLLGLGFGLLDRLGLRFGLDLLGLFLLFVGLEGFLDLFELVGGGLGLAEGGGLRLVGAAGELVAALAALPDRRGGSVQVPGQALGALVVVELLVLD